MLERINIFDIIREHLKTLRSLNQKYEGIYLPDLILFYILPIVLSYFIINSDIKIKDTLSNIISVVAILGGFLFNLLAILYSKIEILINDAKGDSLKKIFVREIHTNISYSILISVLLTTFLIIYSFKFPDSILILDKIIGVITFALLVHFLLTLLMVLKRVYILLKKDIK